MQFSPIVPRHLSGFFISKRVIPPFEKCISPGVFIQMGIVLLQNYSYDCETNEKHVLNNCNNNTLSHLSVLHKRLIIVHNLIFTHLNYIMNTTHDKVR